MTAVVLTSGDGRCVDPDALVVDHAAQRFGRAGIVLVQTGSVQFRFLAAMVAAASRGLIAWDDLVEAMWGDDPEGGPEDPRLYIRVMRSRTARYQRALGLTIVNVCGRGLDVRLALPAIEPWRVAA